MPAISGGAMLAPGTAVRIFTGAPLPPGADTVVREEATRAEGGRVRFIDAARRGRATCGSRARTSPRAGSRSTPATARARARRRSSRPSGRDPVRVHRRPRVAVLSTGDEVVTGRTPDSNGVAVAGLVRALGLEVERRAVEDRLDAGPRRSRTRRAPCHAVHHDRRRLHR